MILCIGVFYCSILFSSHLIFLCSIIFVAFFLLAIECKKRLNFINTKIHKITLKIDEMEENDIYDTILEKFCDTMKEIIESRRSLGEWSFMKQTLLILEKSEKEVDRKLSDIIKGE